MIALLRDLRAQGRLIVVSTHDARLVPIADRVVRMVPDAPHAEPPSEPLRLGAGASIFEQDDPADFVYLVDEGRVDIVRVLVDGGEQLLRQLGPGQYFGELGPLTGFPRSASARAATDVTLTRCSPQQFRERVQRPR